MSEVSFKQDDEGLVASILLPELNDNFFSVVYLEGETVDEHLNNTLNCLTSDQSRLNNILSKKIHEYVKRVYDDNNPCYELIKVYIFLDEVNSIGFMYRYHGDVEHGIGIKLTSNKVERIGASEEAFM
ncbi:hypothetical protein V6243_17700 [Cobetia marina]|uniref:Uncharacterized protein n=1 Tax=Cobetia marina TaxID=28258 RepID=A0ABU9GKK3_COBMA